MIRFCTLANGLILLSALLNLTFDRVSAQEVTPSSDPPPTESVQRTFFENRIRPVLVERCYACHNSHGDAEAGLVLDYRDGLRQGGQSGPLFDPGATIGTTTADTDAIPDGSVISNSLLLQVLRHELEGLEMPADGPQLDPSVIADFTQWLAMGAFDPRDTPPNAAEFVEATSWSAISRSRREWWSFQPISPPDLSSQTIAGNSAAHSEEVAVVQSESAIDQILQSHLAARQLHSNPRAVPAILLRRLYLLLIGIPPTLEELDAFELDPSPVAYQREVDKLLDSPRFGERWGRHWLDWLRYAESHGSEHDPLLFGAYHYRDYIVRALNADIPFDQLVREHIAGDLLEQPRVNRQLGINESLIGTAHWRMVFHGFAPTDALDEKVRFTDDALDTVTKAFLGLTVSCARCHDHKFDAISQADYTALAGVLASTRPGRAEIDLPERLETNRTALQQLKPAIQSAIAAEWLNGLNDLSSRLLAYSATSSAPSQAPHWLHPLYKLYQLEQTPVDGVSPANAWLTMADELRAAQARQATFLASATTYNWNLGDGESSRQWYRYGSGLALPKEEVENPINGEEPKNVGEFTIEANGEQIIGGVFPASVITHALSTKHGGRLTSPDFSVSSGQRLWLQICGDGQAMSRYVVQNFPRDGTVYPVSELKREQGWHWQAYDVGYWEGDALHIEMTTALDAPLLVKDQPRSWFGIRRALLVDSSQNGPELNFHEGWTPILDEATEHPPESASELAELIAKSLHQAIRAWQDGTISDAQAILIDSCLSDGLLPNSLGALPSVSSLVQRYRELESGIPVATRIPTLAEWHGSDLRLYERGNHKSLQQIVPRRFLEAIDSQPYESNNSGRRELAEDILRADNPFTARVIVNRVWHHLFGQGIVSTCDNFGKLGELPSHPELLDYLAHQFREEDHWSLKRLICRMVTSDAWQQSSAESIEARTADPDNRLCSHFSMQRLTAESIRDSLLAVSGELDLTMFGPAVPGSVPRRSIYVQVIRNDPDPFLSAFDAPIPFSCQGNRDVTNVPAQSLIMINGPLSTAAAEHLAARCLANEAASSDRERVEFLWRTCLGRLPDPSELDAAEHFLASASESDTPDLASWIELAHSILNLKEFIYVR